MEFDSVAECADGSEGGASDRVSLPVNLVAAIENLAVWTPALPVLAGLNRREIPVIVLKSLPQVEDLYGHAGGRATGDVDLVVPAERVVEALEVIAGLGWTLVEHESYQGIPHSLRGRGAISRRPWHFRWEKSGLTSHIDLHSDRMVPAHKPPLDPSIWARATPGSRDGVEFQVLGPEDMLLFLCWHFLSERLPQHKLADVTHILARGHALDWQYLAQRAATAGLAGAVHLVCGVAARNAGRTIEPYWRAHVPRPGGLRRLVPHSLLLKPQHGITWLESLALQTLARDRLSLMTAVWREALMPSRLSIAADRLGYWPTRRVYMREVVRIYAHRTGVLRRSLKIMDKAAVVGRGLNKGANPAVDSDCLDSVATGCLEGGPR